MAERSVVVRLRANVADFDKQMAVARRAADELAKKSKQAGDEATTSLGRLVASARDNEQAWTQVGTTFAAVGAAAAVGIGAAVAQYARFDAAMSQVQAATHETAANMEQLREAAIRAGADTAFSAEEAAGAIEELAKAGVSTEQILGGGLDGALALAAAGNIDVAEAAETAASAMTQFGLEGEKVPHIADLLAAGAGKAQGSVSDLGQALNQSGLIAAQTGLTIEETTGGLAAFASAGLVGSDAGTSFKTMLQSLTPSSAAAKQAMDDIGFSAYDADGNFVGLTEVAGRLQSGLSTLSVEQQNATLKTIFGSDAVRAAAVLYEQGAEGIGSWINNVNDAGYAAETAAINMDNLKGDLEELSGSFETALIGTGEAADGPLRTLVQGLTGAVNAYNDLSGQAQGLVLGTGGVVAAVGLSAGAFLTLAPKVLETVSGFQKLNQEHPRVVSGLGKVGKAAGAAAGIAALTVAIGQLGQAIGDEGTALQANALSDAVDRLSKGDLSALDAQFDNFGDYFGAEQVVNVNTMAEAYERIYNPSGIDPFTDKLDRLAGSLGLGQGEVSRLEERVAALDGTFAGMVAAGDLDAAEAAFNANADAMRAAGASTEEITEAFPAYNDALLGVEQQQDAAAESAAELAGAVGGVPGAVGAAAEAAEQLPLSFQQMVDMMSLSEEAAKELRDQFVESGETMLAFVDPLGVYTGLLQTKTDADRAAAEELAAATDSQEDSWEDFVGVVDVSVAEYLEALEKQQADQQAWQENMLRLAGRVSQGTLDELARMGPEGAPLVADLVDSSDSELQRLDDVFAGNAEDAVFAWGEKIRLAGPVLAQIAATAGQGAADAAAEKLAAGTATIEQIAAEYGVALADGVNPVLVAVGKGRIAGVGGRSGGITQADGGVVDFYAAGGLREDHVAQIAPAGAWRVWAEDETGGEAYIPLHPSKRARSLSIWEETGRRLGVQREHEDHDHSYEAYVDGGIRSAQRFANGGFTSTSSVPKVPSPGGGPPLSTAAQAVMEKARADVVEWLKGNLALAYPPATAAGNPYLGGGGNSTIVQIGRFLQGKGARISGHPAWGRVGRHSPTSLHYKGRAIDVNYGGGGANAAENRFVRGILPTLYKMANFKQVYYREIGGRTDHDDHLHLGIANGAVLDQGPKGTVFNPHVRDKGGPLHQGFTLNATGAAEDVVPRHVVDPPRQYAPAGAGQGGGITQQFVVDARGRDGNDVARRIGNRVHDEMVMLRL